MSVNLPINGVGYTWENHSSYSFVLNVVASGYVNKVHCKYVWYSLGMLPNNLAENRSYCLNSLYLETMYARMTFMIAMLTL